MKPLYVRIREAIADEISDGTLLPGSQLENESDLARRFECARMTIAKALQGLVERGLVERRRGVGTFVIDRFKRDEGKGGRAAPPRLRKELPGGGEIQSVAPVREVTDAALENLRDLNRDESTHAGAEFSSMWSVYNEVRRRAGSALDISGRVGLPQDRVEYHLEQLVTRGHVDREMINEHGGAVHYSSV